MNTTSSSAELRRRFEYQFSGAHFGLDVHEGWLNIFAALCEGIDSILGEDKRGFHWAQLKEKFGWARFYFSIDNVVNVRLSFLTRNGIEEFDFSGSTKEADEQLQRIRAAVHAAEALTRSTCVICAAPGEITSPRAGRILCLCSNHRPTLFGWQEFVRRIAAIDLSAS